MEYFVKIDLSSIRKNPNAGSRRSQVATTSNMTFRAKSMLPEMIDGTNCIVLEWQSVDGERINISGEIIDFEFGKSLVLKYPPDTILIEESRKPEIINHPPIGKYSFEYEETYINCINCHTQLSVSKLESDESGDGESYSDTVCPACKEWECCDLTYETIDAALTRASMSKSAN